MGGLGMIDHLKNSSPFGPWALDIRTGRRRLMGVFYRSVIFLPLDLPEVMMRIRTN
jgi:hypothetical protein